MAGHPKARDYRATTRLITHDFISMPQFDAFKSAAHFYGAKSMLVGLLTGVFAKRQLKVHL
jgi:hypothetical protein